MCEVIHRSGWSASSASGPQEQRVPCWQSWKERGSLGKGGVYLDRCSAGPSGKADSSMGKELVSGPVAGFPNTTRERGAGPSPRWGRISAHLAWKKNACRSPSRLPYGACPSTGHGASAGPCLPSLPQKPQLWEETLQGLAKQQQPREGGCLGKNKAPALSASLGSPGPVTTGREGRPPAHCPKVTCQGRPGMELMPPHHPLQIPACHCELGVGDFIVTCHSGFLPQP